MLSEIKNDVSTERRKMDELRSVTLIETKPMDKNKTDIWLQELFSTFGMQILRGKGFFNIYNSDYRFDFQSVRKSFHAEAKELWENDSERKSVVVLIGKKLPLQDDLQKTFSACCVS